MPVKTQPSVLSLYSGAGGMDYGFHLAGFKTIFANDFDPLAVQTFNGLIPGNVGVVSDIRKLDLSSYFGVDLIIGGPPCQGFSVAGKMNSSDPRSEHVWEFLRIVAQLQPKMFVMENVKHLAENSKWADIRDGLQIAAKSFGYNTQIWLLRASHFGVSQNRDRMFLVGSIGDLPKKPAKTTFENLPPSSLALNLLPQYGEKGNHTFCTAGITLATNPVLRKSPYAGMLFNGAGRPINLDTPANTLPASMGGNKTPILDQNLRDGSSDNWVLKYHAHLISGGHPWGTNNAPDFLRRLTVEEAAVIQSFPVEMVWAGGTSSKFRQIGNAVPPLLAKAVAIQIKKSLAVLETSRHEKSWTFSVEELMGLGQKQLALDI